jgi:hypothetical protein
MKIKFYVMHYKKNVERRTRLEGILNSLGIEADWCTKYDKDELTEEDMGMYYTPDLELFKKRTDSMYEEVDYNGYSGTTKGHLSLGIKYIKCMEEFVSSDSDVAVFLEDDVTFSGTKEDIINSIKTASKVGYDGVFFGGGFDHGLIANRVLARYENLLLVDHPATNCTSSFSLTKTAARKVLATFDKICTSIDWELNYHFKVNDLKIWHTYPYICGQLSTAGVFECTL